MDTVMDAVDTFLPYDATVEEKQNEVIEQQNQLEQEINQEIEHIPDVVISLSADTTGLSTVETVENFAAGSGGTGEEIDPPGFTPAEVLPNCTYMPPPDYPEIARLAGVEGVVTLWVYIGSDGQIKDVRLLQTSGVTSLDEAAVAAAYNTQWTSARNNGMPVGVWTTLRYNFALTE
jgi:protein TonB